jgi:hypothetical protein
MDKVPALVSAWIGQLATYDRVGPSRLLQIVRNAMAHPERADSASLLLNAGLAYVQALGRLDGAGAGLLGQIQPLDAEATELLGAIEVATFPAPEEVRFVLNALKVWMTNTADRSAEGIGQAIIAFVLILRDSQVLVDLLYARTVVAEFLGGKSRSELSVFAYRHRKHWTRNQSEPALLAAD